MKLNEEEKGELDQLEAMHNALMQMPGADEKEILRIAKTNGNVPWKVMCAYCDNHHTSYPDWPDFAKI